MAGESTIGASWSLGDMTALVTGGTRGIGYAVVKELAAFGAGVHTCSQNQEELNNCLDEWKNRGFVVSGSVCDASIGQQREKLIEEVGHVFNGKLNILVSNVGTNITKPAGEYSAEEYSKLVTTNFESASHLSQLSHPLLKSSGVGSIVFISSVAGHVYPGSGSVYRATKGALNLLTRYLACEWASDNIRTNCVAPWYTRTSPVEHLPADKASTDKVASRTPLVCVGELEEVSSRVAFLCLPTSFYINGQVISEVMASQPNQASKSKVVRAPTMPWSIEEDHTLIWAYLEAGGDTDNSTNQRRGDLWETILRLFEDARKDNPSIKQRNEEACKGRWKRIKKNVNKWVRVHYEAVQHRRSGTSEEDVINEARKMFATDNGGKKFLFEHAWDMLKIYSKWQGGVTVEDAESGGSSKRSNLETPTSGDVESRPEGAKKMKRGGKNHFHPSESIERFGGKKVNQKDNLQSLTQAVENINTKLEAMQQFDMERYQLQKQMFEYQKQKNASKEKAKQKKMRFQMYKTLLAKSSLTQEEVKMFVKLHDEFKV